jgi:hypothetical protein
MRALFTRLEVIYGRKWSQMVKDDEFATLMESEWFEALEGVTPDQIKAALDICRQKLEWPPSIAQFRNLCFDDPNMPSSSAALKLAVARHFSHPVIALAFQEIGAWEMSHAASEALGKKWEGAYEKAKQDFRDGIRPKPIDESEMYAKLDTKSQELYANIDPIGAKICETFDLDASAQIKRCIEDAKALGIVHPVWDKLKYDYSSKMYDPYYEEERMRYLVKLNESEALTLERDEMYDRRRYVHQLSHARRE